MRPANPPSESLLSCIRNGWGYGQFIYKNGEEGTGPFGFDSGDGRSVASSGRNLNSPGEGDGVRDVLLSEYDGTACPGAVDAVIQRLTP